MKENFIEKPNPETGLKELTDNPQASPLPLLHEERGLNDLGPGRFFKIKTRPDPS